MSQCSFGVMILVSKYAPAISIDETFTDIVHQYEELCKIYDFIDLPEEYQQMERNNSAILRNYYANAIDQHLVDIRHVKFLVNGNIKPGNINERAIFQYIKAEEYLNSMLDQTIGLPMVYMLQRILVSDLYNSHYEVSLFNAQTPRQIEKLSQETELELQSLFDFLNNDTEFHPIVQSWMLHFRILALPVFSEGKSRIAGLMQMFWLRKHNMDLRGLLSLEHEIYLNKINYRSYFFENRPQADENGIMDEKYQLENQLSFGLQMHIEQLKRIEQLLQSYFRKQVDYDKLNPRQRNIMNFVFKRGYKLKYIDENILNKRQKLIMYIIQHRGFISTKELVSEFGCNRKTIQRDFVHLLQIGLVKVIGAGSALKYALNLSEGQNNELEQYNAGFVRESEENADENW